MSTVPLRVLVVSWTLPFPPIGGGQLRAYHLIRSLAARHHVTLVGFTYGTAPPAPAFPLRVVDVGWERPPRYEGAAGPAAASEEDLPWLVSYFRSPAMENTLLRICREPFNVILVLTPAMARFFPCLPDAVPKALDFDNVYSLMAQRAVQAAERAEEDAGRARAEAERTLRYEREVAAQSACCLACSGEEASALQSLLGAQRVHVVPNGVDTSFFTPGPGEDGSLLFTGTMNYPPNVAAAQFFCREIWPLIQQERPRAQFRIVGTSPAEDVLALASETVTVHGAVPDMRPYYRAASVMTVPLKQGGGTRLKILEAAACGKAIVSTTLGAEGLDFRDGHDIVLADSAAPFAHAVSALIEDAPRRRRLGGMARHTARRYDWAAIGERLCEVVEALA